MLKNKSFLVIFSVFLFVFVVSLPVGAQVEFSYPDFAKEFLGEDKHEKINRKVFDFNMKMNKYAIRPLHIIWASIIPKYGMDRIQGIYDNILYPKRLVSNLIQKDFEAVKNETLRFLTNTTIGLGGMFDPAKRYFSLAQTNADMEQALAKYNVKAGPYLVCPVLSASCPRGIVGKALDAALDPSSYLGLPFMTFINAGLALNNSYFMQPLSYIIEQTYADPYDIVKKLYGLENYLKTTPVIEKEVMKTMIDVFDGETGLVFANIPEEFLNDTTENYLYVENNFSEDFSNEVSVAARKKNNKKFLSNIENENKNEDKETE